MTSPLYTTAANLEKSYGRKLCAGDSKGLMHPVINQDYFENL